MSVKNRHYSCFVLFYWQNGTILVKRIFRRINLKNNTEHVQKRYRLRVTEGGNILKLFSKENRSNNSENIADKKAAAESLPVSDSEGSLLDISKIPMANLASKLSIKNFVGKAAADFFLHGGSLSEEENTFWIILNEKAETYLTRLSALGNHQSPDNGPESTVIQMDTHLEVYVTHDQMTAYGCIFPPLGDGNSLSFDELRLKAESEGLKYGIDDTMLRELAESSSFLRVFVLASGKPLKDGEDGKIIDLYSREKKISFEVDDKENIDYKNLNWLQNVHAGDVICKIIPPVPPEDGVNVRGIVLKAAFGRIPKPPMGKNVSENEDHTALVALCDGQLVFSAGCFKVQQMVVIEEDLDSSVGNLDVIGSVTVNGNVFEGFTVKATGDIIVRGSAEGATLVAGGNIQIFQGMNGNFKGRIEAGKNVTTRYLEYCYVSAGGIVKTDSIVSSTVISSDKVLATSGKGMILGSTVIGFRGIEAKTIGNERNLQTSLTIGSDPKLYDELRSLKKEIHELSRKSEENDKNIQFLQKQESLDSKYQQVLGKLTLDQSIFKMNLAKKTSRVDAIEEALKSGEACQIVVNQLFPPVSVTIGNTRKIISTEERMRRIYKSEGEVILGSK